MFATHLKLAWLRVKRRGLRRERARYNAERAGLDQALRVNARDAEAVDAAITAAEETLRRARFAARYPVAER